MPPHRSQAQYLDTITHRLNFNGAVVVIDTHSDDQFNAIHQAFILSAVSYLRLVGNELLDAYWRFRGGQSRQYVVPGTLIAIASYIQTQLSLPTADLGHWRIVQTIAEGDHMQGLARYSLTVYGQQYRTLEEIRALFTIHRRYNGDIYLGDIRSGQGFDFNCQAFLLCAGTNLRLSPQRLNDTYWRYEQSSRKFNFVDTLWALVIYIQIKAADSVQGSVEDFSHWSQVWTVAATPHMEDIVKSCLPD